MIRSAVLLVAVLLALGLELAPPLQAQPGTINSRIVDPTTGATAPVGNTAPGANDYGLYVRVVSGCP